MGSGGREREMGRERNWFNLQGVAVFAEPKCC
jgi:hypothetical protein